MDEHVNSTSRPAASNTARQAIVNNLLQVPDEGWHVTGVSLYIVCSPDLRLMPEPRSDTRDRFWARSRVIGERTLYQISEHVQTPAGQDIAVGKTVAPGKIIEPEHALRDLPNLLAQMFDWAYIHQPPLRAGGVQYTIAHVNALRPPANWASAQRRYMRSDDHGTITWEHTKVPRVATVYMRGSLDLFDTALIGTPRGYFDHYDSTTGQTGYLAFGRTAAVLGGLSDQTLRTFVTLLQTGEMTPADGLTTATFVPTLALIGQWNVNQDVRQNIALVDQLERSGGAATSGQIWISYSLAVIGVALAFISYLQAPLLLAPGMLMLALACVFFAAYARTARQAVNRIGTILFWVGVVAVIAGLALDFSPTTLPGIILPQATPTPIPIGG